MMDTQALRVFISYARLDASEFAEELMYGLDVAGFETYLDRHDIAGGEDWEARLGNLIEQADTVIFVVTKASAVSKRCLWEVEWAIGLSKRLIPVVLQEVSEADLPDQIKRLNYIHFTTGRSFAKSLGELALALKVDRDWIREHTRISGLARRWAERDRDDSLNLRGQELVAVRAWLSGWRPPAPEPTAQQREFIIASDEAHRRTESLERKRTRRIVAGLSLATCIFAVLSIASFQLWQSARSSERAAIKSQAQAESQSLLAESAAAEARSAAARALWYEGMYWLQTARSLPAADRMKYFALARTAFETGMETVPKSLDILTELQIDGTPVVNLLEYGAAFVDSCAGASVVVDMTSEQLRQVRDFFEEVRLPGCTL